jgi:DnaK suppressor protein
MQGNNNQSIHLRPEFVSEMKQALLNAKKELRKDLAEAPSHTELGDDLDSQVQEIESDEVNQDIDAAVKDDLAKIEKALAKIEDGSYGLDDEGKPISEQRLKVMPWADKAL